LVLHQQMVLLQRSQTSTTVSSAWTTSSAHKGYPQNNKNNEETNWAGFYRPLFLDDIYK
jgi:hypothetical protein